MRDPALRLLSFLRPYRIRVVFIVLLVFLTTVAESVVPYLLGQVVDGLTLAAPTKLYTWAFLYLGLVILRTVFSVVLAYWVQGVGQSVLHDIRLTLLSHILFLPVRIFDSQPVGRLLSRVINDVRSLSELFTASMSVLAVDCFLVFATLAAMFWMEPTLSLKVLLPLPIVFLSISFFGKRLSEAYRTVRARLSEITSFLGENIGALATIQRLGAESDRLSRYTRIVESHREAQDRSVKLYALAMPVTNILYGASMGLLLGWGGYSVVNGNASVGTVVAFAAYLKNLFNPVEDLIQKYNIYLSARVAAERIHEVLEEPSERDVEKNAIYESVKDHSVVFSEVSFHYPGRGEEVIHQVSFKVPEGSSMAIVGATGSGKTTLTRLLLRFYDELKSGEISFGGIPLQKWNRFQLRSHFGLVPQETVLFEGSVRDNLSFGKRDYTDAYLEDQCRKAGLWDRISPRGGLDLKILESGSNLSLGERQLIAFARLFAFDAPVLLLDEATASLDRILEKKVVAAIREGLKGRTSLVIAHRLSTVRECDQMVVLDRGKVKQIGTPALLGKKTDFQELEIKA